MNQVFEYIIVNLGLDGRCEEVVEGPIIVIARSEEDVKDRILIERGRDLNEIYGDHELDDSWVVYVRPFV